MTFGIEIGPELIFGTSIVGIMIPVTVLLLRLVSSNARDTHAQRSGWSELFTEEHRLRLAAEEREEAQRERAEQCEEDRDGFRNRLERDGIIPPRTRRSDSP